MTPPTFDRTRELFLELIRIDAVSGQEQPVRDHLLRFLSELGLDPREDTSAERFGGDCGNVICPVRGGGRRLLLAHMDSIASTAGIKPQLLADRITSDGNTILAADDRAGIAALLAATESTLAAAPQGPGFTLAFTVQEETTGYGAQHLEWPAGIEEGMVFDSHLPPGHFVARGYGCMRFRATIHGRSAHAGNEPEAGISALLIAARALADLPWGRIDETTTANAGSFDSGQRPNVVPDLAVAAGEVRALEPETVQARMDAIQQAFDRRASEAEGSADVQTWWSFQPYHHGSDAPVRRSVEAALSAEGLDPKPATSAGGSDANELNARGLPTINLGIGAQKPHGHDEFILNDHLHDAARVAFRVMNTP